MDTKGCFIAGFKMGYGAGFGLMLGVVTVQAIDLYFKRQQEKKVSADTTEKTE